MEQTNAVSRGTGFQFSGDTGRAGGVNLSLFNFAELAILKAVHKC